MSDGVKRVMEDKPLHWTALALCVGDDRYTGRQQDVNGLKDRCEMRAKCARCPVLEECAKWAECEKVVDVYAAGSWREDVHAADNWEADYWWLEKQKGLAK